MYAVDVATVHVKTSVVIGKHKIVLSARIRRKLGIRKGTRVSFFDRNGKLMIRPLEKSYFECMAGIIGSKGKMMRALREEKKQPSGHSTDMNTRLSFRGIRWLTA